MDRITINAVVFRQDGLWVAQCLEYDFVSCAEELEDLPGELMEQIQVQMALEVEAGQQPFADFGRAPDKYWEMFERASGNPRLPEPRSLSQVDTHLVLAA